MKIVVGSDPLGFELKEKIKKHLTDNGHVVSDVGTPSPDKPVLYIEAADNVAKEIQSGNAELGVVLCGSGVGVSIVANKHKGVYCVCAQNPWTARESRIINNANVLALGGRVLGEGLANDIVDTFVNTAWVEGCNEKRATNLKNLFNQVVELENKTV